MRYIRSVLIPTDRPFHPLDEAFALADDIVRERLYHLNLLDDQSAVMLFEVTGDAAHVREILDDGEFYDTQVSAAEDRVCVYAHFDPSELMVELLSLFHDHELILDLPLVYTERGGLRARVIGDLAVIREIMPKLPADVDVKLEQVGEYQPDANLVYDELTDRQQEVLLVALETGYYSFPREATQAEVAAELDCNTATAGEHLRRIEATILAGVTPR
jgi:predicted DNA binding protein